MTTGWCLCVPNHMPLKIQQIWPTMAATLLSINLSLAKMVHWSIFTSFVTLLLSLRSTDFDVMSIWIVKVWHDYSRNKWFTCFFVQHLLMFRMCYVSTQLSCILRVICCHRLRFLSKVTPRYMMTFKLLLLYYCSSIDSDILRGAFFAIVDLTQTW